MKALYVLIMSIFFACGCEKEKKILKSESCTNEERAGLKETVKNVFDDEMGSAYIRVEEPLIYESEKAMIEIADAKSKWAEKFPNKKNISISVVTGASKEGSAQGPVVCGLFIHYETDGKLVERPDPLRH